ncbi:unnamed protein product [Rangifer tarandus platyrhynchus]|uniref:Uncharacterized protein n=1 Tax=Rangifer tarandus platyrhynchus TaxID=3082113 RepID=A0ABN8Y7S5_RANTA|nr:unnamed protein product [Rangifer tarandus platyrhynchus]
MSHQLAHPVIAGRALWASARKVLGAPGSQISWRAEAGKGGWRGLEPRRFSACNRSACIRNLKSEERGRPGGDHGGLGVFGAVDRALRGLGVLRISDGAPDPAKQRADQVSASPR